MFCFQIFIFCVFRSQLEDSSINRLPNIIEKLDVTPYLVFKKDVEDGPEVKGGYIDALIIHASNVQKVTDNGNALKEIVYCCKKNTKTRSVNFVHCFKINQNIVEIVNKK